MASKKISRNDPCPCGSGKKFKNCCLGKGINWSAGTPPGRSRLLPTAPRPEPEAGWVPSGPFEVVDARLKEISRGTPGQAPWQAGVDRLAEATPESERLEVYRLVREAGVLPDEAASFLFGHALQLSLPAEQETFASDEEFLAPLDRHTLAELRRLGQDDLADLFANNRLGYDRRHERGRQFFYGPPNEEFAERLRARGIID